jgi:hypothetical protein
LEAFGALVSQFGLSVALLMFGVLALVAALRIALSGTLVVARWSYDAMTAEKDKRIADAVSERDEWRSEAKRLALAASESVKVGRTLARKVAH